MKLLKNIYPLFLLLWVFNACESDLDKVNYDPDNASFIISTKVAQEYVLDPLKSADTLLTFEWNAPEIGYDASIVYNLETDVAGKKFSGKQILSSSNEARKSLTTGELNSALTKLIKNYKLPEGEAQQFEFRITASISEAVAPLYSNIITSKITPFTGDIDYPKVWIVGDYCDWNHNASLFLYDFTGNDEYEGWIFFNGKAGNGFKVAGAANWDNGNWGLDGNASAPSSESASLVLINDGGSKDIKCYSKNYYKFSFNKNTLELKKVFSMNSLGVVGTVNDWGGSQDIAMEFDPAKQRFSTVITLATAGEIKFRADNAWGDIEFGGADGILTLKGANIAVAAGTYKVTVYLNNSNEMTYKLEGATALDPSLIIAPVLDPHAALEMAKTGKDAISWEALDFGGQEAAKVNYVLEIDLAGSNFANAQQLGSTENTSMEITGEQYLTALTALGKASDEACNVEIRVKATVTGVKDPYMSNVAAYSLTVNTGASLPENIYINGSFNAGWDWASNDIKQMIPVHSHPGMFWGIYYFDANAEIKFSPVREWGQGDFGCADSDGHSYGAITVGTNNLKIANAGFYQILITCTLSADGKSVVNAIALSEPKIYLMGDGAPDGWNTSETNAFTLQNDIYQSPAMTADKAVRMCIKLDGCDWWQTEFNVIEGKIVYRGTGGDMPAVEATTGQVVKLNLKNNTGSIE